MNEQRFETGKAPHVVVVECSGALVIGGWQGTAVLAQGLGFTGSAPNLDQLELRSTDNLTLTVPEKASLSIKTCVGSVTIKHVDGFLSIGTAVQAITLNDVGSTKIDTAGQLNAENINGPLNVSQAQNVKLRNVADVVIGEAADDVAIKFATGGVKVGKVGDRVTLHTINGPVTIGQSREVQLGNLGGLTRVNGVNDNLWLVGGLVNGEHSLQVDGDVFIAWPIDAPLTLVAEAAIIDNQLPLTNAATKKLDDGRTQLTGHIEQGKPFVSLKTTGNIGLKPLRPGEKAILSAADFDFSVPPPTLTDVVATAVSTSFPDATPGQIAQITTAVEAHLAKTDSTFTPPAPSTGQIMAAKAQRKAEQSLQKAADSITEAQVKLTQSPDQPAAGPVTKPKPSPETAVSASQTQILKLLKNGQISVDQANTLLDQLPQS